jgi:hypothetical protein
MIRLSRRFLPAFLLACAIGGCDSPSGPSDVAGTYVLERVGGSPVPAVTADNDYGVFTIVADTLRIGPGRTALEARTTRIEAHGSGTPPSTDHSQMELVYELRGSRITLSFAPCPDAAVCALVLRPAPVSGHFTAGGLVVENEPEFVYRRID